LPFPLRVTRVALFLFLLALSLFDCAHPIQKAQVPPPAPQPADPEPASKPALNVFLLLPEPDGKPSSIVVSNSAGAQTLARPYQAVRVDSAGSGPTPPFAMDQAEMRRTFGAVVDALPAPELSFLLYFGEGSEVLTPESQRQLNTTVVNAIRERHSTFISLIGHTDTTADPQFNYRLGLRRAQSVAAIMRQQGVAASDLFVESHGEADLLVPTPRNQAESRNRRVEVVVR
jgi:outer membrane protein OmpA-like peptidoglycan-associated protein